MNASQRKLRARLGGLTTASRHDMKRIARTGQDGLLRKFEREVDPEGVLPEDERRRRAEAARRAHMTRMALARHRKG